jgi:hypothetical protein
MLEYVEPLVDASKFTVPVPEGTVAVMVIDVPTIWGEGSETLLIETELGVVPGVTL